MEVGKGWKDREEGEHISYRCLHDNVHITGLRVSIAPLFDVEDGCTHRSPDGLQSA